MSILRGYLISFGIFSIFDDEGFQFFCLIKVYGCIFISDLRGVELTHVFLRIEAVYNPKKGL